MKVVGGWFFTLAEFNSSDDQKLSDIGISSSGNPDLEPFRFRLSNLTAYNKSEDGFTTVNVENFRITIQEPFKEFDKFFLEWISNN
jgi:hypothetical protein